MPDELYNQTGKNAARMNAYSSGRSPVAVGSDMIHPGTGLPWNITGARTAGARNDSGFIGGMQEPANAGPSYGPTTLTLPERLAFERSNANRALPTPGYEMSQIPPGPVDRPRDDQSALQKYAEQFLGSDSKVWNNITQSNGAPINVRDSFLNVLQKWEASIPLNQLWMVFFPIPDIVRDEAMTDWGENSIIKMSSDNGSVNRSKKLLNGPELQKNIGCAFAQTVQIPPEQVAIDQVGIPNSRGFLAGPVIQQRQRFASLNIEFLETNVSFVDFLIRPWTILGSHFGAVARKNVDIRTNVMLVNFAKAGFTAGNDSSPTARCHGDRYLDNEIKNQRGFVPRKIWLFEGCQPINVSQERYSYTPEGSVDRRDTEWLFKRYQIILPEKLEATFADVNSNERKDVEKLHDCVTENNASNSLYGGPEAMSEEYWGTAKSDDSPPPFEPGSPQHTAEINRLREQGATPSILAISRKSDIKIQQKPDEELKSKDKEGEYIHQALANRVDTSVSDNAAANAIKYWSGMDYNPDWEHEYTVIDGVRVKDPAQVTKKWKDGTPRSSGGWSKEGGQPRSLARLSRGAADTLYGENMGITNITGDTPGGGAYNPDTGMPWDVTHSGTAGDQGNAMPDRTRFLEASHGIVGNDALNPKPAVQRVGAQYAAGPPKRYALNPVTGRRGSDIFSLLFGI